MTDTTTTTTTSTETPAVQPRRLPVWVIVLAFVVLLSFMGLIGWGLSRSMRGAIAIGQKVPGFNVTTFDGKPFNSEQYAGKVVLVNFWASWCQPCEQEAADLQQAYMHYKDGGEVQFIGLAYVDTEPQSLAYMKRFGITYPNGPDLATKVSQMFRVRGVPETYVIDREGRLAYVKIGPFSSTDEIIQAVDSIMAKK